MTVGRCARVSSPLIKTALLVWVVLSLLPSVSRAQHPTAPKQVLVLYWYDKDFPANVSFDRNFQAALRSTPAGTVEYYAEYLESNRFPGESQSLLFRDYLRQKYADRRIDVVVASGQVTLDFLLNYRRDLFPDTPIVFLLATSPTKDELAVRPGLTGITCYTYKKTFDLALRLHPSTEQVFVISGTLEHDKKFETLAREELQGYEGRVEITYLTDLSPDELIEKTKSLPERSVVLYAWQQSRDKQGKVLEAADVLALITRSTRVPIYGLVGSYVGRGIIGGHVFIQDANAATVAEIALRIANGARAQDVPVENAPTFSMFDWRQLQRWGISETSLPAGSIVLFKQQSFWELYRWRIVGVMALVLIQAFLIVALLLQRLRRTKAEESRHLSQKALQNMTGRLISLRDEEQRRIAAELHDGLGQSLVIINNRALIGLRDAADSSRATEQFEEISSAASSAIDEVREIAYNLRPHELGKLGLVHAIKAMVSKVASSSPVRFKAELDELDGLLSVEAETGIYRIIQEALNNVVRHAEASEAYVKLKRSGNDLVVSIADNGKGISKPSNGERSGFGLVGIAERARMLGGSCVVDSAPSQGTIITLKLSANHSEEP